MKKLRNIISKIILTMFTIYLIVFSVIPETAQASSTTRVPETNDDPSIREVQIKVAEYAKLWVGVTPFAKEGDSLTRGSDSIRFVCKIFDQFGYNVPKNVTRVGKSVPLSEIQLGDIVSYGRNRLGIYVGNGKYVSCMSEEAVPNTGFSSIHGGNRITNVQRVIGYANRNVRNPTLYPDGSNVANAVIEDQIRKDFVDKCVNFANNHQFFYSLDLELRSKTYPKPPTLEGYTYVFDCTSWVSYALHWFLGLDWPSNGFKFYITPQGLVHDKVNFELKSCPTNDDIRNNAKPGDVLIDRAVGGGPGCHVAIYTGVKDDRHDACSRHDRDWSQRKGA